MDRYVKTADALGCSLDYLLCRTDVPEIAGKQPAAVSEPDTGLEWKTGEPTREGRYLCLVDMNTAKLHEQRCEWKDGQWLAYGQPIHELFSVKAWWPLPPEALWLYNHEPDEDPEEDDDA